MSDGPPPDDPAPETPPPPEPEPLDPRRRRAVLLASVTGFAVIAIAVGLAFRGLGERRAAVSGDGPGGTGTTEVEPAEDEASLARGVGTLVVRSTPAGARVYVDGRDVGATPLEVPDVAAGEVRLTLEHAGYEPLESLVPVRPGTRTVVSQGLYERRGVLGVESDPDGAQVWVDGEWAGATPAEVRFLPRGEHHVRAELPGYRAWEGTVDVDPDGTAHVAAVLEPEPGLLRVVSLPPGADVVVDGRPVGAAPWSDTVGFGRHRIEVSLEGFEPETRTVEVRADRPEIVEVTLVPRGGVAVAPPPPSEGAESQGPIVVDPFAGADVADLWEAAERLRGEQRFHTLCATLDAIVRRAPGDARAHDWQARCPGWAADWESRVQGYAEDRVSDLATALENRDLAAVRALWGGSLDDATATWVRNLFEGRSGPIRVRTGPLRIRTRDLSADFSVEVEVRAKPRRGLFVGWDRIGRFVWTGRVVRSNGRWVFTRPFPS